MIGLIIFSRGDNIEIGEINCSKLTGPISTKLGTKHSWVKGIQVCSNEGPWRPFPRELSDNEIGKIH